LVALACCDSRVEYGRYDPAEEAHASWHAERIAKLRAPDGWLTLVGLDFLSDGEWSVGAGADARLRYDSCSSPIVGTFMVEGSIVRWMPAAGSSAVLEGGQVGEPLVDDTQGKPSVVRDGPVSFTLLRRDGRLALRVRDNDSPVRTRFEGIALAPYDPSRVVVARAEAPTPGLSVAIANVLGSVEEQPVAALLAFELDGATRRLVATKGPNDRLFVVFGDSTNGILSHGGGRFLDLPAPVDGMVEIDFNRAINPPCSFTAYATCPVPPEVNRLRVPVLAGELRSAR
jgi:uncharacterized protein (DUF1684 family)